MDTLLGALLALVATSAGAFVVLPLKNPGRTLFLSIIALSAGVMAYSAIEMLLQAYNLAGVQPALLGLGAGGLCFIAIDKLLPHLHAHIRKSEITSEKRKTALLVGTVTLHNIPEGFAIASAFAASPSLGWLVAVSIALQDFPEGLLVSAPLQAYGIKTHHSVFFGVLSGVVEFAAAIIGFNIFPSCHKWTIQQVNCT